MKKKKDWWTLFYSVIIFNLKVPIKRDNIKALKCTYLAAWSAFWLLELKIPGALLKKRGRKKKIQSFILWLVSIYLSQIRNNQTKKKSEFRLIVLLCASFVQKFVFFVYCELNSK